MLVWQDQRGLPALKEHMFATNNSKSQHDAYLLEEDDYVQLAAEFFEICSRVLGEVLQHLVDITEYKPHRPGNPGAKDWKHCPAPPQ